MKKVLLSVALLALSVSGYGQNKLNGFSFGDASAPTGDEWQSPEQIAYNKEYPRAWFFTFASADSAREVLPESSEYWESLNGEWKFNWAPDPDSRPKKFFDQDYDVSQWDNIAVPSNWNVAGIDKRDGSLKYGVPIYVNQPVIFQHKVAVDDWKGGVMRTPNESWTTYKHRNEVGSYRRTFEVPASWDGREVFVNFDGVDSFFYLWINGEYVGFSKNSRNAARFNISEYLIKGENSISVEVYRSSDGSFLEAQDMFRLPGIFRTVALYSTPKTHINDIRVIPDLDSEYKNGELKIGVDLRNMSKRSAKGYSIVYSLYKNKLYSDQTTLVSLASSSVDVPTIKGDSYAMNVESVMSVSAPDLWSAEEPYLYTLVAELQDRKGKSVEFISTTVGFREVEIKDTPASEDEFGLAGRYYYINGMPVKLKGVNRHETAPEVGHAISHEHMEREVMMMKRGNINHVRNSHYPNDPYWYYLCNKYGIYLEDEANIESHEYYYGAASLSHPKEWENAHVARVVEMTHSTINSPSVVIWSLGNEAGPGDNFVAAYDALKLIDKSRPVQYERNNKIVDMGSNQYPSIAWTREAVKGTYNIKYPFHISEYAHSMGNACGNLVDYWEAIESTNFFCGGAIWDWIDQSLYHYLPNGDRYDAYGGNFGDTPNNGQFVMNGIIFGDMTPKPQYHEVQKVYQNIGVKAVDIESGLINIFNKNYFIDLSALDLEWSLYENGVKKESATLNIGNVAPRSNCDVKIPFTKSSLSDGCEYFVRVDFKLNQNMPWADRGFVVAKEQLPLKAAQRVAIDSTIDPKSTITAAGSTGAIKKFVGEGFNVAFDMDQGTIHSLTYGDSEVIAAAKGPKLEALRAFTNNDNWFYLSWFEAGLHNLKHKVVASECSEDANGNQILVFTVESQAPNGARIDGGTSSGINTIVEDCDNPFTDRDFKFTSNLVWTLYRDGSIALNSSVTSNNPSLVLPRLGYMVRVSDKFQNFKYYGRGPYNNYNDRQSGQFIEQYQTTVSDEFISFPKPQDMGNHEQVRWASLTDDRGDGILFVAADELSVSALPYSALDMTLAKHPHDLVKCGDTFLNLDCGVTGLGGNSCGQGGPLAEDRIMAGYNSVGFIIRPASATTNIISETPSPIAITRSRVGEVEIIGDSSKQIIYSLNGGEAVEYGEPFKLRDAVQISAWYRDNETIRSSADFPKVDIIPLTVVYASSEEGGSAKYLVDGDPSTIWQSMYSVTVAQYPHWIDFDASEQKTIKGFSYTPRQRGTNGNIKDYEIYVSQDGVNWGVPVFKGSFAKGNKAKKVTFDTPVQGRYVRFNALSEHGGRDFASGAEFLLYAE